MASQRNDYGKRSHSQTDHNGNGGSKRRNPSDEREQRGIGSEDTVYRYLCPVRKIGGIIGKGGEIAKQLRTDSKSNIRIGESMPGCEDRVKNRKRAEAASPQLCSSQESSANSSLKRHWRRQRKADKTPLLSPAAREKSPLSCKDETKKVPGFAPVYRYISSVMALPLGKLAILVSAGIAGSVLAKEGRASDFLSGAFKIVWKQLKNNDSSPSTAKPRNDLLMTEVNSLRGQLQDLASNQSFTIVTTNGSGAGRYGIVIVVVVVGYGYVWWKGWKLPDMMFATRRSLSDACKSVAAQLDTVYSSISTTKRALSSRIDRIDSHINEITEISAYTKEKVSELNGETETVTLNIQSVHQAVKSLESKINRIQVKKAGQLNGVLELCNIAHRVGNSRERIQASSSSASRPNFEAGAHITSASRTLSLPPPLPVLALEPPSPSSSASPSPSSSNGSQKVHRPVQIPRCESGLKVLEGISATRSTPPIQNGALIAEDELSIGFSSFGNSKRVFTRTHSAKLPKF